MQKHRREHGVPGVAALHLAHAAGSDVERKTDRQSVEQVAGDQAELANRLGKPLIAPHPLHHDPDRHIGRDQGHGNEWREDRRVVVAVWEEHCLNISFAAQRVSPRRLGSGGQVDSGLILMPILLSGPGVPGLAETIERLQLVLADRYLFERELGRGGMATVYLARDIKHDRAVAVKVLLPDLSASIGAERFEREIRVAGRLQHPHILSMYDSGVADGLLYYVMPFVDGESLRDRIDREGQLTVDDALQITLEVADALGYAHKQQIVHRDIKPENVLLTGGHALVADFGIARAVEEGAQKLTQTGMAIGTPVYMAPEQGMGEAVGQTVDIYSLGCMLFEMLAGEPPFSGKNSSAILAKHVMEQVPSIRIVRQSVPEEVEMAIYAAMGKSPADRPQTCAAFAEMLVEAPTGFTSTRLMTMRHTAARRSGSGVTGAFSKNVPMQLPIWRRPVVLIGAALVIAGGGFAAWKLGGHGPVKAGAGGLDPKRIAVLYFDNVKPSDSLGFLADGLTENLIQNLSSVAGLSVVSRGGVGQ